MFRTLYTRLIVVFTIWPHYNYVKYMCNIHSGAKIVSPELNGEWMSLCWMIFLLLKYVAVRSQRTCRVVGRQKRSCAVIFRIDHHHFDGQNTLILSFHCVCGVESVSLS